MTHAFLIHAFETNEIRAFQNLKILAADPALKGVKGASLRTMARRNDREVRFQNDQFRVLVLKIIKP